MSLRQVLTIYNAERQLNEDDVALLNTLRKLNDNDRELLVQGLSDKPQVKTRPQSEKCGVCNMTRKATVHSDKSYTDYHEFEKKSSKKAVGGGGRSASKSARASGMAAQLNKSLQGQRKATDDNRDDDFAQRQALVDDITGDPECSFVINSVTGEQCCASKNDPIHDTTYLSSHEFVPPPASSAAGASGD